MSEPTDLDIGFDDLLGVVELDLTKAFDEAHTWFERQRDREMYSATGGERPDPFHVFNPPSASTAEERRLKRALSAGALGKQAAGAARAKLTAASEARERKKKELSKEVGSEAVDQANEQAPPARPSTHPACGTPMGAGLHGNDYPSPYRLHTTASMATRSDIQRRGEGTTSNI